MTWSRSNARLLTFPRQHCKNMLGWSAVLIILDGRLFERDLHMRHAQEYM